MVVPDYQGRWDVERREGAGCPQSYIGISNNPLFLLIIPEIYFNSKQNQLPAEDVGY